MAPPTPGRHRGPRPQVNNNIGEAGRTTNIAPPKGVPRDSAGHERPEAFFDSEEHPRGDEEDVQSRQQSAPRRRSNQRRDPSDDDDDDDDADFGDQVRKSNQSAAANKKQQQQSARKRQPNGRTPIAAQRARGAERPDKYMLGDDRGRKTGITKAVARRDEDGMEDPNDFFNSSPGGKSVATTTGARSTIKKASRAYRYDEDDDDDAAYDEDGNDMQDDEGTSISPLTYQRKHPSTTGRAPSALRHSTAASGERSVSRKGLSSPQANGLASSASKSRGGGTRRRLSSFGGEDEAEEEQQHGDYYDENEQEADGRGYDEEGDSVEEEEDDDEEEEEAVRAALGAKKTTASSATKQKSRKSVASTSGRRLSSPDYRRDASLDAEDDDEEEEASPSGLMKLDRNGRPVPADRPKNKGKGRASDLTGSPAGGRGRQREVDVFQQQEEEVVQQEYVEQNDYYQDDFGGGGDDEEGEGQYDPHDYGDAGGGGDDDFDSAGEGHDDAGAGRHDVDVQEVDEDGNPISDQDEQMEGPSSRPYAAKNKGKGKGKSKAKQSNPRTQSESPQRRSSMAGNAKQARNRSRQNQSQQPVITEISRKRAREAGTVDIDGVRRSNREKVPRLEYWRNERIIYERRRSGVGLKAIVRVPKEDPAPLTKAGGHKKVHGVKRSGSARATSGRARSVKTEVPEEQGCDDMTDPDGLVWSWEGEAETTRRIAFTERMMDPKLTLDGKFAYQKIYQELDYLASGVLTIPPGGEKGLKSSKDNSYVFCCLQGSVSVTVHRTRFAIGPGGTFFVPRGNMYQIVATSNREVRLFFAQGRRVIEYGDGETRPDTREDSMRFIENEELQAVPEQDEEEEEEEEDEEDGQEQ